MTHLLVIEYRKFVEGKVKKPKESFLVESVGLTELEVIINKIFTTRVKDPHWHTLTQLRTLSDVIYEPGTMPDKLTADPFYYCKIKFLGELTEVYVPAESPAQAINRVLNYFPMLSNDARFITHIKESEVLGYWDPLSEQWQTDFNNRSEMLYDMGQGNYDRNQLEVEGTTETPTTDPVTGEEPKKTSTRKNKANVDPII